MIEKRQLELFVNKRCKLILSNGFSYCGTLKHISETSVTFEDRFDGLKIIDISYIKSIGETRGGGNAGNHSR